MHRSNCSYNSCFSTTTSYFSTRVRCLSELAQLEQRPDVASSTQVSSGQLAHLAATSKKSPMKSAKSQEDLLEAKLQEKDIEIQRMQNMLKSMQEKLNSTAEKK